MGSSSNMHIVPSRNHESCREMLQFVRGMYQNIHQTCNFLPRHLDTISWHQASFHAFRIIIYFLGFKNHGSQCLCPSLDTNVFKNSFRFPPHGINLQTRTQIQFPNPWWFVVACTCSSNLNYGHYMARNSFIVLKGQINPENFQIWT